MPQHSFKISEPFFLESGKSLKDAEIVYHSYGELNEKRDNVIWVFHALTASSDVQEWWPGLFGQGKLFDPDKYFIVCMNNLGSPYGTISPLSENPETSKPYGLDFPAFSIRDSVDLAMRLYHHLDLHEIKLMIGGSCGGNKCLEMAWHLKEKVQGLVMLCSSAKETAWSIGIHESQRMAIEADKSFQSGELGAFSPGLQVARGIAMPFYRSHASFRQKQSDEDNEKVSDFKASSYIRYLGKRFNDRFDVVCYYKLLNALDTHNIARGRGTIEQSLQEIRSNTLCIGINSDIFIPPEEQHYMVEHIPKAVYAEIDSIHGHDAFLIEMDQINRIVKGHFDL